LYCRDSLKIQAANTRRDQSGQHDAASKVPRATKFHAEQFGNAIIASVKNDQSEFLAIVLARLRVPR
jgi:hypothetical protein